MPYDPLFDPPEDVEGEVYEQWLESQDTMVDLCGGIGEVEDLLLELQQNNDPIFNKYVEKNYEQYKRYCKESRYDI